MGVLKSIRSYLRHLRGRIRSFIIYELFYVLRLPALKQFFEPEIRDWDLVFDIGGHLGDKTRFFNRYQLQIVVLEPHPYYYQKLRHKFRHHPNVTILNQGIATSSTTMDFYPSSTHPSVSTFNRSMIEQIQDKPGWQKVRWDDPIEISTVTLEDLIGIYGCPDFVKLDVEGNESQALHSLNKPLSYLSFEYLPSFPDPARKSLQYLEQLGSYKFLFSPKERYNRGQWYSYEQMQAFVKSYQGPSGNIFARLQRS